MSSWQGCQIVRGTTYQNGFKLLLDVFEFMAGLPDFPMVHHTKTGKIYQITIKHTKWPQNIPNSYKIDQMDI
jgi:hypothetical protein